MIGPGVNSARFAKAGSLASLGVSWPGDMNLKMDCVEGAWTWGYDFSFESQAAAKSRCLRIPLHQLRVKVNC